MELARSVHGTDAVLTVSGHVDDVDVPDLRDRVLGLLDEDQGDVLLDVRRADRVDDLLIPALAVARSRAKYLRRRIVVIDGSDGVTALSLRRLGMQYRFPVFLDPEAASAGLARDRAARDRLTLAGPVRSPAPESGERPGSDVRAVGAL